MGLKLNIERKEFIQFINDIQKSMNFSREVEKLFGSNFDSEFGEVIFHGFDFLERVIYGDDPPEYNDLAYFIWELDFGRKWEPGMVIVDGVDVPLACADDLYNLLCKEFNKKE